jgi:L-ascorbate metabolism protein UlaG (beta-lactamase superfamily)
MKSFICLFVLLSIGANQVASQQSSPPRNITPKSPSFKEGLWIKKYPGDFTCFKFETPAGIKIVVDPHNMDETVAADIVTVSHNHGDHADLSRLSGNYKLITTPGRFVEKGIRITGVAGHHNKDNVGENNIFVFDMNGIRLAQFASQGEMPSQEMFAQIGTVDILIIQVCNDSTTKLSTVEGAAIIRRLQPKIIIQAHGGDAGTDDRLAKLIGADRENIRSGELIITKKDLSALRAPRVIMMDR